MIQEKRFRNLWFAVSSVLMISACSSATFPEIIEEDDVTLEDVMKRKGQPDIASKKVVKESDALGADEDNAAYEDDLFEEIHDDEDEKVLAAKVKPVEKSSIEPEKKSAEPKKPELLMPKTSTPSKPVEVASVADESEQNTDALSVMYRLETVYFNNGSSAVDSSYFSKLRAVAKQAKAKNAKVIVKGFASSRTRNADIVTHKMANFNVSLKRAQNVADVLKRYGLASNRIIIEALSDSQPAYLEVMPEGERLNRRAEVYIAY